MRFMSLFIYPTAVPFHATCHCEDDFLRAYRACFMRIVTLSGAVHTLIYDSNVFSQKIYLHYCMLLLYLPCQKKSKLLITG